MTHNKKEFNLEEVLRTGKAVTRDGTLIDNIILPEHGQYLVGNGTMRQKYTWRLDGRFWKEPSNFDLFCLDEPEKENEPEMYVNVYKNSPYSEPETGSIYDDLDEAKEAVSKSTPAFMGTYRLTKV